MTSEFVGHAYAYRDFVEHAKNLKASSFKCYFSPNFRVDPLFCISAFVLLQKTP